MGVDPEDDAATLSEKLSGRAAQILPGIVENVGINGVNGIPQQDEEATYTPMINKEMGKLDWNGRSGEIARQVRALVTWPTAYTFIDGKMLKIFKVGTGEEDTSKKEPGTVIDAGKEGVRIVTGDGSLFLKEVQLENRKKMSALDFTRGYRDIVGKQLK
jgi:methionyl-tRNA formyltransferase